MKLTKPAMVKAYPLKDYIKEFFGTKAAYGRHIGHSPQNVNNMIKEGRIVIDGQQFAPKIKVGENGK